ncbi:MAG: transcriptional repressor [Chitinispirillaceae bacterium]|nr:transcriptional repressor [Chitinispirillaceae bacterium]
MESGSAQEKKLFQIEKTLKQQDLSITNQRRLIIAEILRSGSHFDIESLAAEIRLKNPKTARATVYRTVKILADAGMVKREMLGETHSHYEVMEQEHGHFVCTSCGKIIELACPTLENFLATVSETHDFKIDRHSIELFGICGKCKRKVRKGGVK